MLAHSFIASDPDSVTFVYRDRENPTEAKEYRTTGLQFQRHVYTFIRVAQDFSSALGVAGVEFRGFVAASLASKRAARSEGQEESATTSPNAPIWMA